MGWRNANDERKKNSSAYFVERNVLFFVRSAVINWDGQHSLFPPAMTDIQEIKVDRLLSQMHNIP